MGRRLSDEMIRSYVGEAVADASARLDRGMSDRVGALLMRAGFINQAAFGHFEYAKVTDEALARLLASDFALCALADRGKAVSASDFDTWITRIETGFDARDTLMASL